MDRSLHFNYLTNQQLNHFSREIINLLYIRNSRKCNMRVVLLIGLQFLVFAIHAQKIPNPQPFASTITLDDLKRHLYIVAGKEMEGRMTGTEGERKAAAYIESHFQQLGLKPGNNGSFRMKYPVYYDSVTKSSLTVNGKSFELFKDFSINLNNYPATINSGDIVFVGPGLIDSTRNDFKDVNVAGKLVLVRLPPSAPPSRFRQPAYITNAQKNGAVAILVVQSDLGKPERKGQPYVNGFKRTIYPNTFYVSEQVARAIMGADWDAVIGGSAKSKLYRAKISLHLENSIIENQANNVIGFLEGTDLKDQFVFITAHFDHLGKRDTVIYYGADDDASGTCAVLEIAEAFAKAKSSGKGPRRSIVFMTVSGEEEGLWGSAYYTEHPSYPLEKTTVDLNIDMIGRIDPTRTIGDSMNYVYVVGDDKLSSELKPISESINKKYTKLELDYKFNDPKDRQMIYYRSDHFNFARKGTPIIFYFNGTHADYHRPTDTPEKINFGLYTKRAQLVFYTAWEMANRNEMLKRDLPLDPAFMQRTSE